MANPAPNPLPLAGVPVLDGQNNLTLPWRRALQALGQNAGNGITQLSGEVTTGTGGGVQPATISDTTVIAGTYENANITVGPDGRLTFAEDGGGGSSSDLDPLTLAAISLLDGALTVDAAYVLAKPRTFSYTGDATGGPTSFNGSQNVSTALTLANTAVTPGTYGDAAHVGQFTVDAKGRLTFAQNVAISATGGGGAYVPVTDGAEPPLLISNGAGSLIFVPYSPP